MREYLDEGFAVAQAIAQETLSPSPDFSQHQAAPSYGGSLFASAVTTTHDAFRRLEYERGIAQKSASAVEAIQAARARGDLSAAARASEGASLFRESTRLQFQRSLFPAGAAISQKLKNAPRSWSELVKEPKYIGADEFETFENVARASGRSRGLISGLGKAGRVLGPLGLIASGTGSVLTISDAPAQERGRVVARETGAFAGAAALGAVGTGVGVAVLGTNPPGWAVLAVGALGGLAGGYVGGRGGAAAGEAIYDNVTLRQPPSEPRVLPGRRQ